MWRGRKSADIGNDIITGTVGVVVPLESNLVSGIGTDGLGGLDVGDVALHVLRGDVCDGAVVGGRVDVSASLVADTLVDAVDKDVPDTVEVQVSVRVSNIIRRMVAYVVWAKAPPAIARARIEDFILKVRMWKVIE